MTDSLGLQSPEAVTERYTISKEKPTIGPIGNNVTIQLSSPSDVDNGRERDSSNVHTKVILAHKGDIRFLRGGILTSNGPLIGFRSMHESVGESVNLINLQTKQRHRFKDFPFRTVDLAFAPHHRLLAVLNADSSLYIFEVSENCEPKKYISISNWPEFPGDGSEQPKLSWCPYIRGDDDEEDESSHMVAVYLGRQVYIVNVGILKEAGLGDDIDFADARKEEGALLSHYFSDETDEDVRITAVRISPDSTAVAIAKSDGRVQFFTFNEETNSFTDAHCFEPRAFVRTGLINDLIFLDDLTADRKSVPFWRSCVVVSNEGRKLALYECQSWRCLGRIRFETTLAVNIFVSIWDPSANFVHLLDVDGMNVYTVEILNTFGTDELPRFVSVTQTSFCHPIFAISPISVNTFENADESDDDIFNNSDDVEKSDSDDSSSDGGNQTKKKTRRNFVAMGKKSMVELQMTLKQHTAAPQTLPTIDEVYIETTQPEPAEDSGLLIPVERSDGKIEALSQKIDDVLAYLARSETERKEYDERLVQQIVARLDENMRLREGYMLNRIEQLCESGRLDTIAALRTGLLNVNEQVDSSVRTSSLETAEYISQRVGSSARNALTECLLPAFERSCEVLFERLNEHFRHGINEYLTTSSQFIQGTAMAAYQMTLHQQNQKGEVERILQLVETNPEAAIEAALNKADANVLEMVCSKINPEKILIPGNTKLSQNCLLALVQQFTVSLNRDRDLKFRWIELVIPEIDMSDPEIAILVTPVAQKLVMALQEMVENTQDEQVRRYVRLLYQMARSSLLQTQTPSQRTC